MHLIQGNRITGPRLSRGVLSDVLERFLDKFRTSAALGVYGRHETDGLRCRAAKFPLAFGKAATFEGHWKEPGKDHSAAGELAPDEGPAIK